METKEVRETGSRNRRPVWPFIATALLLLLLLVLLGRSCRQDYGEMPPVIMDTLETDTMTAPPADEGADTDPGESSDTGLEEPDVITPIIAPQAPGGPATPAMP